MLMTIIRVMLRSYASSFVGVIAAIILLTNELAGRNQWLLDRVFTPPHYDSAVIAFAATPMHKKWLTIDHLTLSMLGLAACVLVAKICVNFVDVIVRFYAWTGNWAKDLVSACYDLFNCTRII